MPFCSIKINQPKEFLFVPLRQVQSVPKVGGCFFHTMFLFFISPRPPLSLENTLCVRVCVLLSVRNREQKVSLFFGNCFPFAITHHHLSLLVCLEKVNVISYLLLFKFNTCLVWFYFFIVFFLSFVHKTLLNDINLVACVMF